MGRACASQEVTVVATEGTQPTEAVDLGVLAAEVGLHTATGTQGAHPPSASDALPAVRQTRSTISGS